MTPADSMSFQPLQPGDAVAVVAPAGPFTADRLEKGLAVLAGRGYRVRTGPHLHRATRYFSAPDAERALDLAAAFADPEVRAVFAVRGGYGAMRLLPRIDWAAAARTGKPLVGFSDVTALHLALLAAGGRSVHGPVVTRLGEEREPSLERLFALLETGAAPPALAGRTVVPGCAEGRLVGGCLSLVSRLVGTPYLPSLDGALLLLEDVAEKPYAIDRMWTQLQLAGVLDRVAGVVVGDLTSCEEPGAGYSAAEVVEDLLRDLGRPAAIGLPIGHGDVNLAVPLGARAILEDGALRFVDGLAR
jgi:muramoyltetrapeptide carboxypeptidase